MATGDIRYVITVDASGATKAMQTWDQALANAGQTAVTSATQHAALWVQFAAGQLAAEALRKAFGFLKESIVDSIKVAADSEKAMRGIEAAFAISGRTMPGMVERLKEYAKEMEGLGLATDDEVVRAESLTMQLTYLDEKGIKAVARGAIGLASVFGYDLQSAVEMLSRGMEGQYFALNRLFPAIRNATGEGEKHAALLKIMEGLYGRAIADTDTYAGKVKILGIEWHNAKKELGDAILSTGILQKATELLTDEIRFETEQWGSHEKIISDTVQRNNDAYAALQKMAEAIGWTRIQLVLYAEQNHISMYELQLWVQNNRLGEAAARALAKVIEEQRAAIAAQGKGFSETGKIILSFDEQLRTMYIAAHAHARALLDDSVALTLVAGKLPEPGLKFFMADQATEQEKKIREVASSIVNDIMGISNEAKKDSQIWNTAVGTMLSSIVQFSSVSNGVWKGMIGNFDNFVKAVISGLEMVALKEMWEAHIVVAGETKKAQARGMASVFEWAPFPFDLILAAAAFSAINALFSKLFKFAGGFEGVIRQPTLFLAGEAGPERVSVRNQAQGLGGGWVVNINSPLVATTGLSNADLERAGPQMFAIIERQARRRGGRLLN